MSIAIPTLVEQLTSYLAYETAEAEEYGPPVGAGPAPNCVGKDCYHYYRAARLVKQLADAKAAEKAGKPLPPVMNSKGIAPIWDADGHALPGSGGTGGGSGSGNPGSGEGTPSVPPVSPTPVVPPVAEHSLTQAEKDAQDIKDKDAADLAAKSVKGDITDMH